MALTFWLQNGSDHSPQPGGDARASPSCVWLDVGDAGEATAWSGRLAERGFLGGEAGPIRAVIGAIDAIAGRTVTCCQTTNTGSC